MIPILGSRKIIPATTAVLAVSLPAGSLFPHGSSLVDAKASQRDLKRKVDKIQHRLPVERGFQQ